MFNVILFGPPGSGKGTQSEKLIQRYGFKHLSTGDLLRSEIARETPLGLEAKKLMDKGELVPDEVVIGMISSALDENPEAAGFLFDGFPRTAAQADALDKLMDFKESSINMMLSLEVPDEDLVKRLLQRGLTSGRPDDNNEEVIRARMKEYQTKTAVVAEYYERFGKVKHINGLGLIEEISQRIYDAIDAQMQPE